jgi:hypothetical protein
MADLNPNIIMGVKPIDLPNPLDQATKALSMSNLMQEHQSNALKLSMEQRQNADQSALRNAFKNNTVADADGNPQVNRQGVMKDLMAANPLLAQKQALDFRQMDIDKMNQQHAAAKNILFNIDPTSQQSLNDAFAKAKSLGLPPLEGQLPQSVNDPNFQSALRNVQIRNLTAEEQLAQANKDIEHKQAQQKNQIELAREQREANQFAYSKQFEANQQVDQAITSGRQSADAQQALKDVYAAKKVNTLVAQGRNEKGELDPNKLNGQQVKLIAGEVGKIATGGAPTMDELHGLTPNNVPQILAAAAEKAFNDPTGAEAGKFVTLLQNYSNSVAKDGQKLLSDRARSIIDQRKDDLGPKNYSNYIKNLDSVARGEGGTAEPAPKDASKAPATIHPEGTTKEYGGKTYKLIGDHWVSQTKQAAK